jgi:hypothetical protein
VPRHDLGTSTYQDRVYYLVAAYETAKGTGIRLAIGSARSYSPHRDADAGIENSRHEDFRTRWAISGTCYTREYRPCSREKG